MHDLISRQAAIDALDVLCQEHRYKIPGERETYSQYNEAWQDALDRAEAATFSLPPAQQWIPVSERLPDGIGCVLVCGREALNNSVIYAVKWYDNGVWRPLSAPSCSWEAWMPLPEPYKEEKE